MRRLQIVRVHMLHFIDIYIYIYIHLIKLYSYKITYIIDLYQNDVN